MARKRAVKQRLDLRKGGRVRAVMGLSPTEREQVRQIDKGSDYFTAAGNTFEDEMARQDSTIQAIKDNQTAQNQSASTTTSTPQETTTSKAIEIKENADNVSSVVADRQFGERTTDTEAGVDIAVAGTDPSIQSERAVQLTTEREVAEPEDISAQQIDSAQADLAQATQQESIDTAQMSAAEAERLGATEAATGEVSRVAETEGPTLTERAVAAQRDATQETQARATAPELAVSQDAFVKQIVGETADVVQTSPAEKNEREAVIGMPAPSREEAQIINEFGFGASKNRVLRGTEAKEAAANRLVSEHGITKAVADSILEDVGQLATDIDGVPQEALGAVAELPKEALVSSQMESLLAGMENGEVPAWARSSVAGVEQKLAERGLEASTIGRDALFNAIIQSTLPIAQSNATALQQRATQNLSNEQQALIQDRQIAADFLSKNAVFKQQMELANLTNDQQMRLANLTALNQAGSENLNAAQQTDLANLNTLLSTNQLSAKLASQMGLAQLNVDQQTAIRNASMVANIDFTKFNAEQQVELANSKFMQTMTMSSFNADQQVVMQNATALASMDLATADQNTKLAITNAKNFLSMDMANLTNEQQATVLDQQLMQQQMLSNQASENAARQFNATSENQMQQFMTGLAQNVELQNMLQFNAMSQFNTSEANRTAAINAQNDLAAERFNSELASKIEMFEEELQFRTDSWNAANEQAVEQSNIEWRRKANTIDTAAQNAANQASAKMSFNMSMSEQNFLWQQLRDEAAFDQQSAENSKERGMALLSALYGNAELMRENYNIAIGLGNTLEQIIFGRVL